METIQFSKRTLRINWRDKKKINASLYLKTASDQDMPLEMDVYLGTCYACCPPCSCQDQFLVIVSSHMPFLLNHGFTDSHIFLPTTLSWTGQYSASGLGVGEEACLSNAHFLVYWIVSDDCVGSLNFFWKPLRFTFSQEVEAGDTMTDYLSS